MSSEDKTNYPMEELHQLVSAWWGEPSTNVMDLVKSAYKLGATWGWAIDQEAAFRNIHITSMTLTPAGQERWQKELNSERWAKALREAQTTVKDEVELKAELAQNPTYRQVP